MALLVNGERIENAEIEQERKDLRRLLVEKMQDEPMPVIEQRAREWARENVIERILLKQAALRDPEPIPAEKLAGEPDSEIRLRIERLLNKVTVHAAPPRRKDLVEYYKKHAAEFQAPEAVHAAHIVKNIDEKTTGESAQAVIEQVQRELQAGKPFEQLADEFSDCPGRGGDLGYFPRGEMVDEFDAVAFALPAGAVSGIVRTQFGFHLIKVYERRKEGLLPFESVSDAIGDLLFSQKKQKLVDQHLDALRAKARIEEIA